MTQATAGVLGFRVERRPAETGLTTALVTLHGKYHPHLLTVRYISIDRQVLGRNLLNEPAIATATIALKIVGNMYTPLSVGVTPFAAWKYTGR